MRVEFAPPPPRMAPFVSIFYRIKGGSRDHSGLECAGHGHLRFNLKGRLESGVEGNAQGRVILLGPRMQASQWRVSGAIDLFGFVFSPLGWARAVGVHAHRCADRHLTVESVFGEAGNDLLGALRGVAGTQAMVDCACAFLHDRMANRHLAPDHQQLIAAVEQWLDQGSSAQLEQLFAGQPWSARQTTRLVNQYFGAPPKMLQRRARALAASAAILNGNRVADLVADFYDQPHMINEIRTFTGCTPGGLHRVADPLSRASLAGRFEGRSAAI